MLVPGTGCTQFASLWFQTGGKGPPGFRSFKFQRGTAFVRVGRWPVILLHWISLIGLLVLRTVGKLGKRQYISVLQP